MPTMGRQWHGPRVFGPYLDKRPGRPRPWYIVFDEGKDPDGARARGIQTFRTKKEALQWYHLATADIQGEVETIDKAIDAYKKHLGVKGNKPGSIKQTEWAIRRFFDPVLAVPLSYVTPRKAGSLYMELVDRYSTDSHRGMLAQAKSFMRWCRKQGWVSRNPIEDVEGVGRRSAGKPQLRVTESQVYTRACIQLALRGDDGALACLMALWLGMRASEIVERKVRDIDEEGRLLWIPSAKTSRQTRAPGPGHPGRAALEASRGTEARRGLVHD